MKTRDWDVGVKMRHLRTDSEGNKKIKSYSSIRIAAKLGLIVQQITARLAAMEKRGIVRRTKSGDWSLTREGWRLTGLPRPAETVRVATAGGGYRPDDSAVPRVQEHRDWRIKHLRINRFSKREERHILYIASNDQYYTKALDHEPADLIFTYKDPQWQTRIRRSEHSVIGKKCGREIAAIIRERREQAEELARQEAMGL
jgi:hypothetical protein